MEDTEFLGINIIIIVSVLLAAFVYLVSLINKRRKEKFLHKPESEKKNQ